VEEKCKFAHAKREHWKKNVVWQMLQSKWKDAETSWSLQDQTRHVAEHKSKQLFLLAESSAFVAAFQMIVLYEQSMPGPSDQWFHPAFLAIWGALSTSVACMCMIIMFVSTSLAIFILQKSSNDAMANVCKFTAGFPTSYSDAQLENLTENERKIVFRHNFTSNSTIFDEQARFCRFQTCRQREHTARPDGVLTSKAHLESIWNIHCDQLFRHVVIAFSWNIPLFFCSLAMMAVTKFYQWPKTQVICGAFCIFAIICWRICHVALVPPLIYRSRCEE